MPLDDARVAPPPAGSGPARTPSGLPAPDNSVKAGGQPEPEKANMATTMPAAAGHPDMDYAEHERTFHGFVALVKWSVVFLVVLLILMAWFLL
jgi:Bacterial aa3 type cytochrome c oxidase subunit IV